MISTITNRTAADLALAITLRNSMIAGQTPSVPQLYAKLERGFFTYLTVYRIETAQEELSNVLKSYGYSNDVKFFKKHSIMDSWSDEIYSYDQYQQLIKNNKSLMNSFCVYSTTPVCPEYLYEYNNLNDFEKILADIQELIYEMEDNFKKCGTIQCGGDTL